ncbi:MAG: SDR family oxidoreductase [Rhodospirillaceae bacterium]|nr:SDR family oxidoreductase [Rhodospirillaceae bacterium]
MTDTSIKTALITGSARRIGRALALGLAADGWAVALHHHQASDDADKLADTINSGGGRAVTVAADLADEIQAVGLITQAVEKIGPLTCLINNASLFEEDTVVTATRHSWDAHMQVNLRAPFVLIQGFAEQLATGAGQGNVINIIDQRVWNLPPTFTSYTLSKAGLWTLTQTLAQALAPDIRINAIGPGPVLPSTRQTDAAFREQWSSLPLPRRIEPEEIVDAARYILQARSLTGQMIAVDGGQHLGWAQATKDKNQGE